MSYILDALKKSDQQRQHAKAPTLLSTHATPAAASSRRVAVNLWWALALIGIGLLIGWWRPWQTEAPVVVQPTYPVIPPPASVTLPEALPKALAAAPPAPSRDETPVEPTPAVSNTVSKATAAASPADNPTQTATEPPPEIPLLQQHELPPEVRQSLPAISIAFHQYASQPGGSRVMINNSVLHAGDAIAPGLKLEQITADGVILSYQGYRFQRGVR